MNQHRMGSAFLLQGQDAVIGMGAWLGDHYVIECLGDHLAQSEKSAGHERGYTRRKSRSWEDSITGFTHQYHALHSRCCSSWPPLAMPQGLF